MNTFHNISELISNFFFPLLCTLLAVLVMLFGENTHSLLRFDRQLILEGELWRVVTCNFTHTNWYHLVINYSGFLLIWGLFLEASKLKNTYPYIIALLALNTITLLFWSPAITHYVGFSGALHGIVFMLAVLSYKHQTFLSIIITSVFVLKISYEQYYGASSSMSALIDADVAVDAHLTGAICGFAAGLIHLFFHRHQTD